MVPRLRRASLECNGELFAPLGNGLKQVPAARLEGSVLDEAKTSAADAEFNRFG
jgi:hypothetical protein